MTAALTAFGTLREILRVVLLTAAAIMAVIAVGDWLVRTRRVSPFSPVARFFRTSIDPWLEPVERRVVRAGGLPATAPWWALAAIVIGGIVLLALVDFVGVLLADLSRGIAGGPGGFARLVIYWAFTFLRIAILVRVIASWLPISPFSPWIRWSFTLSEPILRPLRRVIPPFRSIDITPIIAFFALVIVESLVRGWLQ
ncbi:MAG TPA: YggT family protein [Gemmatimonadaceae bacterium]